MNREAVPKSLAGSRDQGEVCRVAMVTTHPIQYQVPWLRMLSERNDIDLHVYFAMIPDATEQGREFGVSFEWDMPLLDGYSYSVLKNVSVKPSITEFGGCDTPEIGAVLAAEDYDAVIVNGWGTKTMLQALWACWRTKTPCIVRGEANGLRPRAWWKRTLHSLLVNRYAAALAIGTNNREYYERLRFPMSRVFLTPYCVDNEKFLRSADTLRDQIGVKALREGLRLSPERTTFLFSGKLVAKKRPGDLVLALRQLVESGQSGVQALIVGDGPLRAELEAMAEDLPVVFSGFLNQSQISRAYAASDALVLPSDSGETWGLVANEAMASGLPVIMSDQVGSAVDLVVPGKTGEVYPCGSVEGLAACMERISGDTARAKGMGNRARTHVLDGFSFEGVVRGVTAALEYAASSRRRSPRTAS